ncbi:fimbrial protein [Caballeronia sp. TF1N1]|uniref:fimbrial protein n=1 Tax=Caballeronia sp. TF1N1 TaxID=2878153 RepID=UPI001FCFDB98|nr:fimbrial protein [Caballeronia sp. TF1N1]
MKGIGFARLRRYAWIILSSALVLTGGMQDAWADACTGGGQSVQAILPATISVPRDLPVGAILAPWSITSMVNYVCTMSTTSGSGMYSKLNVAWPKSSVTIASTPGPGLASYTVLQTNVPGVGMAIAFDGEPSSCGGVDWLDVVSPSVRAPYVGWTCTAVGSNLKNYGRWAVALVKTGVVSAAGVLGAQTLASSSSMINFVPDSPGTTPFYLIVPAVTVVPLTCQTPDVPVPLGTHFPVEMASVGATTAAVPFNISLNNCPSGMNGVLYEIDPTTSVLNSSQSVVALNGSSSATGVGVQLLDGSGAVFPLSTTKAFSGYNSSTGGSYVIPMKARYYRTGTVTPGPANTSMILTMTYQ